MGVRLLPLFFSFLKIGFLEVVPQFIFSVVEGCDLSRCDFHYYEFEHIYIGFSDTLQLFFGHVVESGTGFINFEYLFVDVVVVYLCCAVDENASNRV